MQPTREHLKKIFPQAKPALVAAILDNVDLLEAAGINTPDRLAGYFASIGVESMGLTKVDESLTYTTAQRIYDVFKGPANNRRFKSVAECQPYVRNPKALAIKVYGGRMGNARAPSTDGYDYRGGGFMQTTGREGYRKLGYEDNPGALRIPATAFRTSVQEWKNRKCNQLADRGRWREVRIAINGGENGLAEFLTYVTKALRVFAASAAPPAPARASFLPPPEPAAVEQDPPPPEIDDVEAVSFVQMTLYEKGYTEVGSRTAKGTFSGISGPFTEAAIMAARKDNGLPLRPYIDQEFLDLLPDFPQREIAKTRTDASTAEVTARVPEAASAWWAKTLAWFGAGTGVVTGLAKDAVGMISPATETLRPLRDLLIDIPAGVWIAATIGVAVVTLFAARAAARAQHQSKEAFRDGSRR